MRTLGVRDRSRHGRHHSGLEKSLAAYWAWSAHLVKLLFWQGQQVIAGFALGFFAGREHLRSELRQSIASAFGVSGKSSAPAKPDNVDKSKKQTNTTSSKNQDWEKYSYIKKEDNAMDDTTKYTLSFPSDNEMVNSIGMRENGRIVVQCDCNKTSLYVIGVSFLSSDGQTVKMRWDNGTPINQWWGGSQSGTALFSGAPRSFMAIASKAKKLVLQYSPYSRADEIAIYKFSPQLQYDFKKMLEYCK